MKDPLSEYSRLLELGIDLEPDQVCLAAKNLTDDYVEDGQKYIFLQNLATKGETNEEFTGFVSAFRKWLKTLSSKSFPLIPLTCAVQVVTGPVVSTFPLLSVWQWRQVGFLLLSMATVPLAPLVEVQIYWKRWESQWKQIHKNSNQALLN